MSDFFKLSEELASNLNSIQPVADDFFADGTLDQYARIDHQHPLSESLRTAIYNSTLYIKKSGDTVSGPLSFTGGGNSIAFGADASYISFFNAGFVNRRGYLQGNTAGLILSSEAGILALSGAGGINLGGGRVDFGGQAITGTSGVINGYTMSIATLANRIVCANSSGYIIGNYINMTADVVAGWPAYIAGQNGDNYLRWYNRAGTLQSNRVEGLNNGGAWNVCGISSTPAAGTAGVSMHPGGIAVVIAAVNGLGNSLYIRDSAFNANTGNLFATSYNADSSKRWKKNINNWPMPSLGAASEKALDVVARLRPVTFQSNVIDVEVPPLRRANAHLRLNRIRAAQGRELYNLPEHNCAEHDCRGSAENPCTRRIDNQKYRLGLIAEEVAEIMPSAVHLDIDLLPEAIDIGQLAILGLAAIKELTERVIFLEEAS